MGNYLQDILDQPRDLRVALDSYYSECNLRQMRTLAARGFKKVIFAGMGSSNFCSIGASIELNNRGFLTSVVSAGELLHYEIGLLHKDTLLVLVSQSGESAEVVRLIGRLPKDCAVAALTNDMKSTLGRRGDYAFHLNVPDEESVTTRTYLASVLLVNLLAESLSGGSLEDFRRKADTAIGALERFLAGSVECAQRLEAFVGLPPYLCVIGRGHSLGTARSGALFLREVVKYPALDFDAGEFRHGPFEMVDDGFCGIVIAPKGNTCDLSTGLARDIGKKGGHAILVTNDPAAEHGGGIFIAGFDEAVEEPLSPVVSVAPIQLLADSLARRKGLVPGRFRWGSKVTTIE